MLDDHRRQKEDDTSRPSLESYYTQPELWKKERFDDVPIQRLRARLIAALIDTDVESILDVGCGNGFITKHLHAGGRVVGLDPSEEALKSFEGESVIGTADDLPFEDRSFGAVVCAEVMEHLSDDALAGTVSELARVARMYLVIGVPYRQDLRLGMTQCARCGRRFHVDLHQQSFDCPQDIIRLFPGFAQEALVLLGSRTRIRSGLFRRLRYLLLGPGASHPLARCPECGSDETVSYRQETGNKIRRWLFEGLAWRMRRETVPYWMIVLLRRAEPAERKE